MLELGEKKHKDNYNWNAADFGTVSRQSQAGWHAGKDGEVAEKVERGME